MITDARVKERDFALADDRTVGDRVYGAEDGALVVVLDGPGSRGLGRALASPAEHPGINLLVPNRPGFGRSIPSPTASSAEFSRDLLALVNRSGFRRFGIGAQSGGSPYARAGTAGKRATSLSFIGAIAPLNARRPLQGVSGRARAIVFWRGGHRGCCGRYSSCAGPPVAKGSRSRDRDVRRSVPPADRVVLEDPVIWAIRVKVSAELVSRAHAVAGEMRLPVRRWEVDYGPNSAPVALWIGGPDRTHSRAMSERLARRLGGAPVTVVPGAATLVMRPIFTDALRHAAALTGLQWAY